MPLIQSAKKKLRKDLKRTLRNQKTKETIKGLLKQARRLPSDKTFMAAFSALDKAVKTNLIHANKAARLKSRLSKQTVKSA